GTLSDLEIRTSVDGDDGIVDFSCDVRCQDDADVTAELIVGDASLVLRANRHGDKTRMSGQLRVGNALLWWPHTHGMPHLYPCSVRLLMNGQTLVRDCDPVGFRQIVVQERDGDFAITVNGTPVFCRGACWTVSDIVSLASSPTELSNTLRLVRDA